MYWDIFILIKEFEYYSMLMLLFLFHTSNQEYTNVWGSTCHVLDGELSIISFDDILYVGSGSKEINPMFKL